MKIIFKELVLFHIGATLYIMIELIWRGYSHWTMFILGGVCFVCLGLINEVISWNMVLWKQALLGASIVTILEFITGCIINIYFRLNVWDYSNMRFNILGQVCLVYFILWIPLSIVGIILDDYLRYWMFKEEKPHYKILVRR
ncbi:hypothetical protein DS742_26235 [Lacrimispora amygdalina]|uniref:Uncharacterized protein n=1 Tax=Lacrimispora amygdalina TaxID=253257 RepID=A0A3E2N4W2_9FIRM|nr:hypothetical protein [Clostridium indicum]RFZ75941.1 hypothetical protein DS742_26235 [Clostridium indicum]